LVTKIKESRDGNFLGEFFKLYFFSLFGESFEILKFNEFKEEVLTPLDLSYPLAT